VGRPSKFICLFTEEHEQQTVNGCTVGHGLFHFRDKSGEYGTSAQSFTRLTAFGGRNAVT
jgi:hypothetical protein